LRISPLRPELLLANPGQRQNVVDAGNGVSRCATTTAMKKAEVDAENGAGEGLPPSASD
jgi:hypothetical protein